MVFNEFNNASSDLLATFLLIHKEGTSYKVFKVENGRRLWSTDSPSVDVLAGLELSIVDQDLRISLWIPPDMWAHKLSSSGVAGCTQEQ
jgi:hypothetical protein